jgi:hypothetical protein
MLVIRIVFATFLLLNILMISYWLLLYSELLKLILTIFGDIPRLFSKLLTTYRI